MLKNGDVTEAFKVTILESCDTNGEFYPIKSYDVKSKKPNYNLQTGEPYGLNLLNDYLSSFIFYHIASDGAITFKFFEDIFIQVSMCNIEEKVSFGDYKILYINKNDYKKKYDEFAISKFIRNSANMNFDKSYIHKQKNNGKESVEVYKVCIDEPKGLVFIDLIYDECDKFEYAVIFYLLSLAYIEKFKKCVKLQKMKGTGVFLNNFDKTDIRNPLQVGKLSYDLWKYIADIFSIEKKYEEAKEKEERNRQIKSFSMAKYTLYATVLFSLISAFFSILALILK